MKHELEVFSLEVFSEQAEYSDGHMGFTEGQRTRITEKLIEFGYQKLTTDDREIIHCGPANRVQLEYIVMEHVRQLVALPGVAWVNVFFSKSRETSGRATSRPVAPDEADTSII